MKYTLYYNEQKLKKGTAECIAAANFIKDVDDLSLADKQYHFRRLTSLNEDISNEGLQFSLNFHPSDRLSKGQLVEIAHNYVEGMGLNHQPYLVYRHNDAAHPHLHVIAPLIQQDGNAVNFKPKRFFDSQQLSKQIENEYHLVHAENRPRETVKRALKLNYGERPVLSALSQILDKVVPQYKHTSLEELNAVLRLYNIEAYRGKETSRIYQHRGLIYRVLNEQGRPTGSYIKASDLDSRPTLDRLEKYFSLNKLWTQRMQAGQRIRTAIDATLYTREVDKEELQEHLEDKGISMVQLKTQKEGKLPLFYVDHETQAVFEDRQLGKEYMAESLARRCLPTPTLQQRLLQQLKQTHHHRTRHGL